MYLIGAKDKVDKALVRQYSKIQTTNFDDVKVNPDEMWAKITMLSNENKAHINFTKKVS
ncbi:MAG TPA: hypothetical protein P5556_03885 [Candidatus Gastranaerophilales bacterium]|nr:hypothetical protein [Candidatus Gastranaerophilales bacterium]